MQEVVAALGVSGHVIGLDDSTLSEETKKELAWHPTGISLRADLEAEYFAQTVVFEVDIFPGLSRRKDGDYTCVQVASFAWLLGFRVC